MSETKKAVLTWQPADVMRRQQDQCCAHCTPGPGPLEKHTEMIGRVDACISCPVCRSLAQDPTVLAMYDPPTICKNCKYDSVHLKTCEHVPTSLEACNLVYGFIVYPVQVTT